MARALIFLYGIVSYAVGMSSLFVFAAYLPNLIPGLGINSPSSLIAYSSPLVNILLLLLFGVQHSIMVRASFKKKWTAIIPKPMERSTYVLISGLILWAIMLLWYPMPGTVWEVKSAAVQNFFYVIYAIGWVILVSATFLINHFDLFGLRQVYLNLKGQEPTKLKFVTPMLYKAVRHPIYFGFLIVLWCTPVMSMSQPIIYPAKNIIIITAPFY